MRLLDIAWQLFAVQYPAAGVALVAAVILLVLAWGVRLSAY